MKRRLQRWWKQRLPRERLLVVVVALCAVGALLEASLLGPQRDVSTKLAREVDNARARLQQMQGVATQQVEDGESALRQRRISLQQRREKALKVIGEAQVDLIAPQEMTKQLQAILVRHPSLRFVTMNTVAPKPLVDNAGNKTAAAAGIFQHGLEVSIEGPYLDLLVYLEALERAPYKIYWRELELKLGPSGVPVTRLAFFTLSREAAWLRL